MIPSEWKTAVVTPLYKKKGELEDINNYRAISVLPPIAKLFEKMLTSQILEYLKETNILSPNQYGFRENYSCEAALHDIISHLNTVRSKRLICMLLFIDFKKAFDLVDSNLLLLKLQQLGFDHSSIELIKNYFQNRSQITKYGNIKSELQPIKLGVPQGSVLGPLFFLIFINDMVSYLDSFNCTLFADDTTLSKTNEKLDLLLNDFYRSIQKLIDWCKFNRLDINWKKTKIMFVTNKRNIILPNEILIDNNQVEVVDSFKLLGITIDNKLNFLEYVGELKKNINKRLFSIKRLFYLSNSVRIQFFKSFIMPHYDYCMSLYIYFPKASIQKISNSYNLCLYMLFNFKPNITSTPDFNDYNNKLQQIGLFNFQHRFIQRTSLFIHKILNLSSSPPNLKNKFIFNSNLNKHHLLRNSTDLYVPSIGKFNHYGEETFEYFFSKFINNLIINDINLNFTFFKSRIMNNINLIFILFTNIFNKFDLNFKNFNNYI
jgi:hypothetical protein